MPGKRGKVCVQSCQRQTREAPMVLLESRQSADAMSCISHVGRMGIFLKLFQEHKRARGFLTSLGI